VKRAVFSMFAMLAVCAFAAVRRDAYRDAYRAWRQTDPSLERDAGSAGPALGADADRVANEAAKYTTARAAYLMQFAAEQEQNLAWLNQARAPATVESPDAAQIVASELAGARHSLEAYGNDSDPAIQQVRGMLERENLALVALASFIDDGRKAAEQLKSATAAEGSARLKALAESEASVASIRRQAAETNQEASAWVVYYRTLSDAARGTEPSSVAPTATTAPELRVPTTTPVPITRYTGAWTFPVSNGMYHGLQPEFVDVVVHDESGHCAGTLFGRFKVSSGDPVIRFDFSGDFQNRRNQVFNLETSDGAKGTIQLIPGPAFNLLEVNFQTDPKPGKIRQANVVLVRK
jgi:hypothetical protein